MATKNIVVQKKANSPATILSTALLLDIAFGMQEENQEVINAVDAVLKEGYRSADIADSNTPKDKILTTDKLGERVIAHMKASVAI